MYIRYALQFHNFRDCTVTLAYFASTILAREVIGDFLSAVEGIVAKSVSWKAKTAALDLLQVSVFFNMPTILCNPEWVSRVMSIVVASGIESEERVEGRVKAGTVLSGLLHCQFVGEDKRKELMVRRAYSQLQMMTKIQRQKKTLTRLLKNAPY